MNTSPLFLHFVIMHGVPSFDTGGGERLPQPRLERALNKQPFPPGIPRFCCYGYSVSAELQLGDYKEPCSQYMSSC
jgi:hypothetical protein